MKVLPYQTPSSIFHTLFHEDFRRQVVRDVLEKRKHIPDTLREALNQILDAQTDRIEGARRNSKAPLPYLIKACLKWSQANSAGANALMGLLLACWIHVTESSHLTLIGLNTLQLERPKSDMSHVFFNFVMAQSDFDAVMQSLKSQHPDMDTLETQLALMTHLDLMPVADVEYESLKTRFEEVSLMARGVWQEWLTIAREEPPDSTFWENIDHFVEALQTLSAEKRTQRIQHRPLLAAAIQRLRDKHSESEDEDFLGFFEAQCVHGWQSAHLANEEAEPLIARVDELRKDMETYWELRHYPVTKISARQELDTRMRALEGRITDQRNSLDEILGIDPALLPPPDPPPLVVQDEPILIVEDELPIADDWDGPDETESDFRPEDLWEPEDSDPIAADEPVAAPETEKVFNPYATTQILAQIPVADLYRDIEPVHTAPLALSPSLDIVDSARAWQQTQSPEQAEVFLWNMVALGDWEGAYWLTQAVEKADQSLSLSSDFCAVMAGAAHLTTETLLLIQDLNGFIARQDTNPPAHELLAVGATLTSMLTAPDAGFYPWLQTPRLLPSLHPIVTAVNDFIGHAVPLAPQFLLGVSGAEIREQERTEVILEARRLIEVAPQLTMSYQAATQVWRKLMVPRSELRELLQIVATNNERMTERAQELAERWHEDHHIDRQIKEIDQALRGKKLPITGGPLRQINKSIKEICVVAQEWVRRTNMEAQINLRGDWLFTHVETLRRTVREDVGAVRIDLDEFFGESNSLMAQAAARAFARQIARLLQMLELDAEDWSDFAAPLPWHGHFDADVRLMPILGQRLLWANPLALNVDTLQPDDAALSQVPAALGQGYINGTATPDAIERWLTIQDYRFVPTLLEHLQGEEREALKQRYDESLDDARYSLRQKQDDILVQIEQAIVDGVISDDERSGYSAKHETVKPQETLNLQPEDERLEAIRHDLVQAREARLSVLRVKWQTNRLTWARNVDPERWHNIERIVESSFDREDTRVVEEYLDYVSRLDHSAEQLALDSFENHSNTITTVFPEFWEQSEAIEEALGARGVVVNGGMRNLERIKDHSTFGGLSIGKVSTQGRERVTNMAQAWQRLKQMDRLPDQDIFTYLQIMLSFLQFTFNHQAVPGPFEAIQREKEMWHVLANMSANEDLLRPIPQFGSQARGRHDVLCVWERPGADGLGAHLFGRRLDANSMIVFYFGRMSRQRRLQFMRNARDKGLAAVVVDEVLLAYVAVKFLQQKQSPQPTLMQCALPFAYVQPYTPGQAGNVPPEMFFGREEMARELQQSETCIVYGGRQLGKSALLRQVQRRFHAPDQGRYAHVEDIKLIGDPSSGITPDALWRKLRDCFKGMGLIARNLPAERTEDIINSMDEALHAKPDVRVVILLDEADNFLEADAEKNFYVVDQLRDLMNKTGRRFKVVFAGLHNVQRFQGIPNQPLAHFGKPLSIGPLKPVEALRLVQQPFEILGFQIDNPTALRILSYTNYHPGLIQLFCAELLKTLYRKPRQEALPYIVTRSDVEAVYLKADVRNSIRERFTWTLALDMRYQAVAWAMIENQLHIRDSYSKEYNAGQILDLVRMWWPQGFEGTEMKPLLDEMKGLGLLAEQEGRYRLRSPNLVRLMGEENVEDSLLKLSDTPSPSHRLNSDHHHSLLDSTKEVYSPLTIAQERALNMTRSGVALMIVSQVSGSDVRTVLRRLLPIDLSESEKEIRELKFTQDFSRQIEKVIESRPKAHQYVLFCQCTSDVEPHFLATVVEDALEWSRKANKSQDAHQRQVRVIFVLEPASAWVWLHVEPAIRQRIETLVVSKPWTEIGIKQWLDRLEARTPARVILKATGGWHALVEQAFQFDVLPALQANRSMRELMILQMMFDDPELVEEFRLKLGLADLPVVEAVLHGLCREFPEGEWLSQDMISLIEDPRIPNAETAQRALDLLVLLHYVEHDPQDEQRLRANAIIHRLYV